jgi:rubredoxin
MQVSCINCDWTGDSSDGQDPQPTENEHGVTTSDGEVTCPECGGELVKASN